MKCFSPNSIELTLNLYSLIWRKNFTKFSALIVSSELISLFVWHGDQPEHFNKAAQQPEMDNFFQHF